MILAAGHPLPARDCGDSALLKRARNKSVPVDKGAIETGPLVVRLRQREKISPRAHRPRIDREINYFFVKQLRAQTVGRGAPSSWLRF